MPWFALVDRATGQVVATSPTDYRVPAQPAGNGFGFAPPVIPTGCDVVEVPDRPQGPVRWDSKSKKLVADTAKSREFAQAALKEQIMGATQKKAAIEAAAASSGLDFSADIKAAQAVIDDLSAQYGKL